MYNYVQLCEGVYLPFSASFFDFLVFFYKGSEGLLHDVVVFLLPNRPFGSYRTPSLIANIVDCHVVLVRLTLNPRIAYASIVSCLVSWIPVPAAKVVAVCLPPLGCIKKPPFCLQELSFLSRLLRNLLTHLVVFIGLGLIHFVVCVISMCRKIFLSIFL